MNIRKKIRPHLAIFILPALIALIVSYILLSVYLFFFKDTNQSYSLTQTWNEYYNVEDWNLASHAITDIDGDGQKDMVTFTNCAFLSSVSKDQISPENRCVEPNMSIIVFQDKNDFTGQKLFPRYPFIYQWLHKSYLVKTQNDKWRFYDMNGLQLKVYALGNNKLFHEIQPSTADQIDMLAYQFGHLGIAIFLLVFHL